MEEGGKIKIETIQNDPQIVKIEKKFSYLKT